MNNSVNPLGGLPPPRPMSFGTLNGVGSAQNSDITNKSDKPVGTPPPLFGSSSLTIEERNFVSAELDQEKAAEDVAKRLDRQESTPSLSGSVSDFDFPKMV